MRLKSWINMSYANKAYDMELITGYRTKMSQNRRCRRPSRTPVTSSHQNPILKIELCQNRRRHRSSRLPRVDVTSSHQNLILKIELAQNRRRHRSSRLPRVDVTSSHQNLILKIELAQNRRRHRSSRLMPILAQFYSTWRHRTKIRF